MICFTSFSSRLFLSSFPRKIFNLTPSSFYLARANTEDYFTNCLFSGSHSNSYLVEAIFRFTLYTFRNSSLHLPKPVGYRFVPTAGAQQKAVLMLFKCILSSLLRFPRFQYYFAHRENLYLYCNYPMAHVSDCFCYSLLVDLKLNYIL